ncbi:MAG: glucokinase [Gammaproteobacteria bacterium]|nr:glucokinase [Gammaproteobacteria bacterium]
MDLIADIGATNSRCALLDDQGRIGQRQSFENRRFDSLESLLEAYVAAAKPEPSLNRAALAIAAPLQGDKVRMTNVDWQFSGSALRDRLGLGELTLVNDFEAVAHALPRLAASDVHAIGGGRTVADAPLAVIGPGSGLGVATAVPSSGGWVAVAGEGGHVTVPPATDSERQVVADVIAEHGHCSAERLLSGPGLVTIYRSLSRRELRDATLKPADGSRLAGERDALALQTFDVFFGLLGSIAGNLALTVGARGGVFIGGGIVPRMIPACEASSFRQRFIDKGRYRGYLDAIPTRVITADLPALLGLKAVLGYG